MRKANKISIGSEGGSSSSHAGLISDNSEVVQLLVRASEQYAQVSTILSPNCIDLHPVQDLELMTSNALCHVKDRSCNATKPECKCKQA